MYKHFNKNLPEWSIFSSHRAENSASFLIPKNNCFTWFYCRCPPAAKAPMLEHSPVFPKFFFENTDFCVFNLKKSVKICVVCPRISATLAAKKALRFLAEVRDFVFFGLYAFFRKDQNFPNQKGHPLRVSSDLRAAPNLAILGLFVFSVRKYVLFVLYGISANFFTLTERKNMFWKEVMFVTSSEGLTM